MRQPLVEALAKKIPAEVFEIFNKFKDSGFEIYLVGGPVRDLMLGKEIINPDFTTNATPEEMQKILPESFYNNIFGTVALMVKTKNGEEKFEITTYRGERNYDDKRRPEQVWWETSLDKDLERRESTINAMAIGPNKEEKLELIDLFDGEKDLKNKIIRAVGDPDKRFAEDALRMIRTIRFASQIGLTIEPATFAAIQKNASSIKLISSERVRDELFKILSSNFPTEGITLLLTSGLLEYILPELSAGYNIAQAKHHKEDVWTHSILSLKNAPSKDPLVRLATLIHDIGKPVTAKGEGEERTFHNHEVVGGRMAEKIAQRFHLSNKETDRLVRLVRWHLFTVDERQTDSAIRRFIRNVGTENLEDMLALRTGDRLGGGAKETSWRLEKFKERLIEVQKQPFSVTDLKINGKDVMGILEIKPGPKVGEILNQIFEEVVEKKIENERENLLKRLEEIKTAINP